MTPTSPPGGGSTSSAPRPPARNKSSSALSTHTLRSLSSTTSAGKPRRNKSSSSLAGGAHHHSAGHHPVSFAHHRKNSHGAHAMRRQGSASGGSQRKPPGGGPFGLGMTSMPPASESGEGGEHDDEQQQRDEGEHHGGNGDDESTREHRPDLGRRRTSSSSTATVVASDRGGRSSERGRSRSRSRMREDDGERPQQQARAPSPPPPPSPVPPPASDRPRTGGAASHDDKGGVSGSVTSSSEWESSTDSPAPIGKRLPDVEVRRDFQPEDQSALGQALDERGDEASERQQAPVDEPAQQKPPGRANGKKAKFSLGVSDDLDDPEEIDRQAAAQLNDDHVEPAPDGAEPAAASSPTATAAVPAMPAILRDVELTVPMPVPPKPEPDGEQEAAGLAAPAPVSAPQHLSPPDTSPVGAASAGEPSLASAAQPELAFPNKPPSNPPSNPNSQPPSRKASGTQLFRPGETLKPNSPPRPPSPIRPTAQRTRPLRKSSNASIMSGASTRSHVPRPAPQFRRSASGAPAFVDRGTAIRAELASPGPDSGSGSESQRREVVGERGPARAQHHRGESVSSMRSLRQAADATAAQPRRSQTLGPADAQRVRVSEPQGTALAKLGTIAAAHASRSTTPLSTSAGASGYEGALTHAKRSASGYFSALRGFTGLPAGASTPPLSPSAGTAGQRAIPGASSQLSSSYGRSSRPRSSPSPRQPALVVKFVEPAPPAPPPLPPSDTPARSTSPTQHQRPLSAQHRTASSASLGPMSRTQQKALLARDAPQAATHSSALAPPAQGPGVPSGLTPAQQQFLLLQQQRAAATAASASSASPSPAPQAAGAAAVANGMQKWAFGLVREAERIERQYRAVEKWRDPLGESLERVLVVRQRARRRREDDREKVKAAIAAQQAQQQQQLASAQGAGAAAKAGAGSGTATPNQVAQVRGQVQRSGASSPAAPPPSSKGKQRVSAPA
ncbi:hypothetical protein JCM3775_002807 [Rhodotorula graminis]|uniref:Uncharacterized protein n=1 Tax=Rhodotorula graminis (strain WP1) TaxID=578459 RepID=A0A0P9F9U0_RHOGW|nr:uncharacterized protein RHOBADRAFT_55850 [Rhodotorula graminis WP1]KPV72377.1 hypothetical protein RHOBADRAFT_55850 [Rhodotorula graminis WP1]